MNPTEHQRVGLTAAGAVAGFTVFIAMSAMAAGADVAAWELDSFRLLNNLPSWMYVVIWVPMQFGALAAIPVVATAAWFLGRHRLAIGVASTGFAGYVLAKVAKDLVGRGRPSEYLDGVTELETFVAGSLGYPSGHAVVAATITALCLPYLTPRWRVAALAVTLVVFAGRVYNGGHLPLDVVGGGALGTALGLGGSILVGANQHKDRRFNDGQ